MNRDLKKDIVDMIAAGVFDDLSSEEIAGNVLAAIEVEKVLARGSAQGAAASVTDAMCEAAVKADQVDRIQGFTYKTHHVIRDVFKPFGEQKVWEVNKDDADAEDKFYHQCRIERMRAVLEAAMAARTPAGGDRQFGAGYEQAAQAGGMVIDLLQAKIAERDGQIALLRAQVEKLTTPTDEMIDAFFKAQNAYAEPYPPEFECGVQMDSGLDQETADMINEEMRATFREGWKIALSDTSTDRPPAAWLEAKKEIDAGWPDKHSSTERQDG